MSSDRFRLRAHLLRACRVMFRAAPFLSGQTARPDGQRSARRRSGPVGGRAAAAPIDQSTRKGQQPAAVDVGRGSAAKEATRAARDQTGRWMMTATGRLRTSREPDWTVMVEGGDQPLSHPSSRRRCSSSPLALLFLRHSFPAPQSTKQLRHLPRHRSITDTALTAPSPA